MPRIILAGISACALLLAAGADASAKLVSPWNVSAGASKPLKTLPACEDLPPPITNLATETIYQAEDLSRTEIDPQAQARYLKQIEPVRKYVRGVIRLANSFALSKGRDRKAASCAARALAEWAKAGAMSGAQTQIAMFNRATMLAGISAAYIQIRESRQFAPGEQAMIEDWLRGLAAQTRVFYQGKRDSKTVAPNNIQYWGSLGVAMAAIAANDKEQLAWAVEAVRLGACQATPEGALPRELARKQRALHYHLFAITPLVMLAEIAERNDLPGYDQCGGALHRVISFALRSLTDQDEIEALSGAAQISVGDLASNPTLAWLEPYAARFPDKSWLIKTVRPLSNSYLGGNLTKLYGN